MLVGVMDGVMVIFVDLYVFMVLLFSLLLCNLFLLIVDYVFLFDWEMMCLILLVGLVEWLCVLWLDFFSVFGVILDCSVGYFCLGFYGVLVFLV